MQEKNDIAETFLERVLAQENENIIAWTLYALLYEQKGQELNAEITLKKALKINQAHLAELNAPLNGLNELAPSENAAAAEETSKKAEEGKITASHSIFLSNSYF